MKALESDKGDCLRSLLPLFDIGHGAFDMPEALGHAAFEQKSVVRQHQPGARADEQLGAQRFLQSHDHPADSDLRHVQLIRRAGNALLPRDDLKHHQRIH